VAGGFDRDANGRILMLARRSVLTGGVAAGLVPAFASLAKAQVGDRSRDVIQAIASAKGQAENMLAGALFANLSEESAAAITSANERIFAEISGVIGGIPAEEAILYADTGQIILAEQVIERGVPAVPQTLAPIVDAQLAPASSEDLAAIAAGIVNAAFGVKDFDTSNLGKIASELGLASSAARIAGLIRSGNLALAAEFMRAILTQLAASPQTMPAIEKALGADGAKAILATLSARFVMFVGWPIVLVSILFAISRERGRLVASIEKAGL
jgi:hypothetical protein